MKITIDPFDTKSINKAIKQLDRYKQDIKKKERMLLERLESIGATKVSLGFARSVFTETQTPPQVSSLIFGNTLVIKANGKDVCFIEFGAGVRFGQGYPGTRPNGVVGIGEYGKGHGNNPKGWWFTYDGKGKHTYGNPPGMVMYRTVEELTESIIDIAREVFKA